MTSEINETHDPNLKSWVESANDPNTDFPIQNLPFCLFDSAQLEDGPSYGVVIGDKLYVVGGWRLAGRNPEGKSPGTWEPDALVYDFTKPEA